MKSADTYQNQVRESFDQEWSRIYREEDQQALTNGGVFEHYGLMLRQLSESFGRPIDALDVGCGTGRYFHCLRNVERLVGTDLSAHMLQQAKSPIHAAQITISNVELLCGDLPSLFLPPASFDLIYSIGVYGEYSPFDLNLVELFWRFLKPNGVLFVTVVDALSRVSIPENLRPSFGRKVVRKAFPMLPGWARSSLNRRLSPFYVTREAVEGVFRSAHLSRYQITSYVHTAGWSGTHLDCLAYK